MCSTTYQKFCKLCLGDLTLACSRPGMRPFSVCTLLIVHEHAYFISAFEVRSEMDIDITDTQTRHQSPWHGTLTQAFSDTSEHVFGRRATDVHARFSLGAICRPYTHTCSHGHAPSSSFLLHVSMLNMPPRTSARPHAACTSSFAFHSPSVTVPSALVYLPGPSRTPWTKLPSYVSPVSR